MAKKSKNTGTDFTKLASTLKALGNNKRLETLAMLRKGETPAGKISEATKQAQAITSHNLKVLQSAGLVSRRKDGRNVYYSIAKDAVANVTKVLNSL